MFDTQVVNVYNSCMNNTCKNCGVDCGSKKFCSQRCTWVWHNKNRTLTPNQHYNCKVCGKSVSKWVAPSRVENGTDTLEYCSRTCAGVGRRGENHHQWKGGVTIDKDGYVLRMVPSHPHCNSKGQVREHRLVMEKHIGRFLLPTEVVHHKNDNPADNRIENLHLYDTNADHKRDDSVFRKRNKRGQFKPKRATK